MTPALKKIGVATGLLLFFSLSGQQVEELASRTADYIRNFFKNHYAITAAVTSLENRSALSTAGMERIYQLIYSRLSEFNDNRFLDFLVDFSDNEARFNLSRAYQLHFLIHLKLIQNGPKTGMGIAIFSRRQDRLAGMTYIETQVGEGESAFLEAKEFNFAKLGFEKISELEAKPNLMDIATADIDGASQLFFFYPEAITVYNAREHGLEKSLELKLQWEPPFYPVLHYEGKLRLFLVNNRWLLTAGANFSAKAKSFTLEEDKAWHEGSPFHFVPMAQVLFNQKPYLVGGLYETGKNYFQDRLLFMPLGEGGPDLSRLYEKKLTAFYDAAFSSSSQGLELIHMVNLSYQYVCTPADFSTPLLQLPQKGGSLAILDNRWLAISDYTTDSDRLFFLKIENAAPRPVYENSLAGEILFIAPGRWQGKPGFWVYTCTRESSYCRYRCEFWSKSDE